jgi:hypothetical protein
MKKKPEVIIFIVGLLITIITSFQFVTKEKVIDLGNMEVIDNNRLLFEWLPLLGIAAMAAGACAYLFRTKIEYSL